MQTDQPEKFDTGAFIRSLRGNLTQAEFAKDMGVGRTTIIRYESNERVPDAEFLLKLNVRYGVDPMHAITGRRPNAAALAGHERLLIDNYRACSAEDQNTLESMAKSLAEKASMKKGK